MTRHGTRPRRSKRRGFEDDDAQQVRSKYQKFESFETTVSSYKSKDAAKKTIHPKTQHQRDYLDSLRKNIFTFATGSPGTGKTLLALYHAVQLLEHREIDKIILIRPSVDIQGQRGRGYLKGDKDEKDDVLLTAFKQNLEAFMSPAAAKMLLDPGKGKFEFYLLEDLRGATFNRSFIIVDEAQNFDPHGIKTCMTRIGEGSTMALLGDSNQKDTLTTDGLKDAIKRMAHLPDFGVVRFNKEDVQRNGIISVVLEAYGE